MRVVAWNCHGDGIGKLSHLATLRPDIAVIPEYGRHPTRPPVPSLLAEGPRSFISFGVDGARGMSVASWGAWELTRADVPSIAGQVIGAVNVTGPADVALVAVWACFSGGVKINPVIEAIDAWGEWLAGKAVVVTGDFNSGHFWDDKPTVTGGDHRPLVAALERIGLRPVCCTPGADGPTSHWHNNGKVYHIDHLFIPAGWCGTEWSVGESDPWRTWSDHAPLLVTTGPADG